MTKLASIRGNAQHAIHLTLLCRLCRSLWTLAVSCPYWLLSSTIVGLARILYTSLLSPFTRYNLLSNGFDNPLCDVYKHSTGSQTNLTGGCIVYTAGFTTRFHNRLNKQWLFIQHGCQTGLANGWMFVYTIQPVVKPV